MRGMMSDRDPYAPLIGLGQAMVGLTVGQILTSRAEGDLPKAIGSSPLAAGRIMRWPMPP